MGGCGGGIATLGHRVLSVGLDLGMRWDHLGPFQNCSWVRKLPQQVRALVAKPDSLSSIPGTHMVEGESQLLSANCPLTSTHSHAR